MNEKMRFFYEDKKHSMKIWYGTSLEFGAHLHNHLELVYMISGSAKVIIDSKEWIIRQGDVLLIFPNQIHQYQKIDLEEYLVCIFPPDICPEFLPIVRKKLPISPLIPKELVQDEVGNLLRQIEAVNREKTPYYTIQSKGYFLVLLSELFAVMQLEESASSDLNTIKEILNFCSNHFQQEIHLEMLETSLHISKYHISHLFREKLGMGFQEYIGMMRTSAACRLLEGYEGEKQITDIAYQVGFNSTRSFNRVFLKYTGMTPREYQKSQYSKPTVFRLE